MASGNDVKAMWIRLIPSALAPFSLYFAVRWTFAPVVVLLEKPLIRRAFERSNALTRGRWWQIWGHVSLLFCVKFRDSAYRREHNRIHPYLNKSDACNNPYRYFQMDGKVRR